MQVHATAIRIGSKGILIRGTSASGKSDLALRLIDQGAALIADDRCELDIQDKQIILSAPQTIHGLLEVRGLGIVKTGADICFPLTLIVDIVEPSEIERMPEELTCDDYELPIAVMKVDAFQASTPAKIRMALKVASGELDLLT